MPSDNLAVVGLQWGDEGKGKVVHALASSGKYKKVARYQGGPNAGHTVYVGDGGKKFVLHTVPAGIFCEDVNCVIGDGVVVDPIKLLQEVGDINRLTGERYATPDRLFLSERAHLIMPWHIVIDNIKGKNIGTTGRGIGPCYANKVAREGIRVGDLFDREGRVDRDAFYRKVAELYEGKVKYIRMLGGVLASGQPGGTIASKDEIVDPILEAGEKLLGHLSVRDTGNMLYLAEKRGESIIFEGAQGTMLSIDCGTYPFVTSSDPTAGGIASGVGYRPEINKVLGVTKAYTTRVGEGPFPTELDNEVGRFIRERGGEFGATTGRPRRCGWFDVVQVKDAIMRNMVTNLAVTKLDVLGDVPNGRVKACTMYKLGGGFTTEFPSRLRDLQQCEPGHYEEFIAWEGDISGVREFAGLPKEARDYVKYLERILELPVSYISVGPRPEQKISFLSR